VIEKGDIAGTLVKLIKEEKAGRRNSDEITAFKSVDSAVVNILASQWVHETCIMLNYITL
jgi:ornithine cyclodeaminase/alanine dehydrogenase-like protein (mu-crystallin family)